MDGKPIIDYIRRAADVAARARHVGKGRPGQGEIPLSSQQRGQDLDQDTSPALVQLILNSLEKDKAEDVVAIDLKGKTSIADDMIVASGRSQRHVGALAEHLLETLKEAGHRNVRIEGLPHCDWVLIDAGDTIVHLFRPEVREFYRLEKLWGADAMRTPVAVSG
jgi:ribosome-associated protein